MMSSPFSENTGIEEFENAITEDYEHQVIKRMLEEARWLFSGMIYGYKVTYTPSDISRSVDRFYKIETLAELQFGDPRLELYDTFHEENIYHLFFRYRLDTYQQKRIDYWNSGVFDSASSYGRYPLFGENSRINSVKDAIRLSLESLLKPEEFNKPSLIEAEVLLRNIPSISIDAGVNRAFVKLRVDIKNVQHYLTNN
ncbi:MAG: hypothetical protein PF518_08380 [Spirochaetaceae bacterium]|jgi:hypothetical protein|nr:hypothetical protein [Spirochaetaceae bacterium]